MTRFSGEKLLKKKKCFSGFSANFHFKHFSFLDELSEIQRKIYIGLQVKYRLFLSDFNETQNFIDRFWKNTPISNFMKIRPVGAESFLADGRTDGRADRHDEANGRLSQFLERV
jgi:hypothetical protein